MRITPSVLLRSTNITQSRNKPPVIQIVDASFYKNHHSRNGSSPPLLLSKISFNLPSSSRNPEFWAVISASTTGKTSFLEILRGLHICVPPNARSYPYLSTRDIAFKNPHLQTPARAIRYVGFSDATSTSGSGIRGAYLSARYESRRESTDYSLRDYLKGSTILNPFKDGITCVATSEKEETLARVVEQLKLESLLDLPVGNLSNGQNRRARIAKALMDRPEVLLLDEPFMGLDPPTTLDISNMLGQLASKQDPRIVLALRPQDSLPEWITNLVVLDSENHVTFQGTKRRIDGLFLPLSHPVSLHVHDNTTPRTKSKIPIRHEMKASNLYMKQVLENKETLVEMSGVELSYGERKILGDWEQKTAGQMRKGLWWSVKRGQRWGIFGPNGSGKTTILSLMCSDHPQTYSLPIKLFGRSRLPIPGHPGISIFDIQARIGHSSPEVHAFFPKTLTIRQTLENAWADTFLGKAKFTHEDTNVVDACLRWFERELNPIFTGLDPVDELETQLEKLKHSPPPLVDASAQVATYLSRNISWANSVRFCEVSMSAQRVALLLRAIIKKPDLVILDEAFSGMDEFTRDKCMTFLAHGETRYLSRQKTIDGIVEQERETFLAMEQKAVVAGLEERQALICVSHLKEEVPRLVTEWMCLPEPNEGKNVRFGKIEHERRDRRQDSAWWRDIWSM